MRELYHVNWDEITTIDELKFIMKARDTYSIIIENPVTDPKLKELIDKLIYIKA